MLRSDRALLEVCLSTKIEISKALGPQRRPLDLLAYGLMLVLCATWGFQQVAIKATVPDMAPVLQLALRFGGSALIFCVLIVAREGWRTFADGTIPSGTVIGLLFAAEFLLLAESLKYTTAAHAVVFLYTAPVFSALGLQFLPEERLSTIQWGGIAAAVCGIAIAFLGNSTRRGSDLLLGDGLALLGGICWGASTVALRRSRLAGVNATKTVFYQVLIASGVLGVYAWYTGQAHAVLSERVVMSLAFQTLGVACLSYLAWFWLLRHYLTSRLMLLALMTPVFGVILGAAILQDDIDARFAVGTLCVLAGIAVVNGAELLRPRR